VDVTGNIRRFEGYYPIMGDPVYIDPSSVVIGNVEMGDHVSIWPHAVLRGDPTAIRIGSLTNIQDNCVVHAEHGHVTRLGEYCVVGHGAIVHGCTIEDGCMVGMGSIIMNDVTVGKGGIVGAGTLLTEGKSFPPGSLILGSPGNVVRELSPEEIGEIKEAALSYWDKAAAHLKQR
jgi:carbonic anhydrase/acetyltransferase-like protein (isoleucine patch superfamily)